MTKHELFRPGENPRLTLSRHTERGAKKFLYTYKDLAELYGVSLWSIRMWVRSKNKILDPSSLESICRLWAARQHKKRSSTASPPSTTSAQPPLELAPE